MMILFQDCKCDAKLAEQFVSTFLAEAYKKEDRLMHYYDFYDYWDTLCFYKYTKNGKEYKRIIVRDYTDDEEFSGETGYSNSEHQCGYSDYSESE